ncbi:trypsin-like peptidase domain-containing protein [Kitasatospora sp. NPDC058965]|uniref:effector-associated domain 2-containing protein n=1 Tax=Kitasatospora sp. NPDC058965 TaxID=3346682 RepID=UPI003684F112
MHSSHGGLDVARAGEILVGLGEGRTGRRGSGYRVSAAHVLTAAHVVRDAVLLRVRLDADRPSESVGRARTVLVSAAADLALLELLSPPGGPSPSPPRYGVVPERDITLACSALGFPRFKLREDPVPQPGGAPPTQYRDSCHAVGTLAALSNRRAGTLELSVPAPREDPDPHRSPWEGMSGAAVWSEGVVIGLVSKHHPSDGPGRLAAVRVDRWYLELDRNDLDLLHRHAGLPADPAELVPLPASPTPGLATAPPTAPPPPAGLPENLSWRSLGGLIEALIATPVVRDAQGRTLLLESIRPEVAAVAQRSPALRIDVINIVRSCLHYPGALDQLIDTVRMMEGDSTAMARLDAAVAELTDSDT